MYCQSVITRFICPIHFNMVIVLFAILTSISADANGYRIPVPTEVDSEDALNASNNVTRLTGLTLNGAHHTPLLLSEFQLKSSCFWVSVDGAHYGRDIDSRAGMAEIGACHDLIANKIRMGIGVGVSYIDEDSSPTGDSKSRGNYILAEMDYLIYDNIIGSITGLYGSWDTDIDRIYEVGGSIERSYGETDIDAAAIRLRLDWVDAFNFHRFSFSPRIAYTYSNIEMDDYTESGGSEAARFNGTEHDAHELRYGLDTTTLINSSTRFRGMIEGVHRFDDETDGVSGDFIAVPTAFSSANGREIESDWARIGAEVTHQFIDSATVALSINASTRGEDPNVSGGLRFNYFF